MRIFQENLYYVTTGAESFFEIIAHRSNTGKINIGDNALDLLGVKGEERGFLARNLFSGGDSPIILLSDSGALIVNRQMLYSTGVCCIAKLDITPESVCLIFERELICKGIMSPKAKELAAQADPNSCNQAYLAVSKLGRMLSVFGERTGSLDLDMAQTALRICDGMGCDIQCGGEPMAWERFIADGMVYSNSIYALSVLLLSFLAKIISDDRILTLEQSRDSIRLSVNCECDTPEVRRVTDYILQVSREREIAASVNVFGGVALDICPFFVDIGLRGVKNPARLKEE